MTPLASTSTGASRGDVLSSTRGEAMILGGNPKQSLRPASYLKVMDLAKSYNIDAEKIKFEIQKINAAKSEADNSSSSACLAEGKDDLHSYTSKVTEDSELSGDKKQSGTKGYPKRFSAINGGFNLCLLVGKVEIVVDKFRVDKSRVRLAEVEVGDETGSISLRARDNQIDELEKVSKEGGAVVLRNSSIELFQGKHLRLAVSKWGKISVYPDNIANTPTPPSTINKELNLSIVDLNLVPPDVWLQLPSTSPLSHKSGESANRQDMNSKQHSQSQHGHQQFRKKGKNQHHNDRKHQSQQTHMAHSSKMSRMQNQNYSHMIGVPQNMMTNMNAFSQMYPGTQYYSSYEDQMQAVHQRQRLEQQKQQNPEQQFLLMQQQHFQLQRQMEQMEQLLYSQRRGQQTIDQSNQAQIGNFVDTHSVGANSNISPPGGILGPQISPEQNMNHQHSMGSQTSALHNHKNRRGSWTTQTNTNSPMTMEIPMSPQMNPLAASFAPHYSIPDIGPALHHHSQQQYYLQPQQGSDFSHYSHPSAYAQSQNRPKDQDSDTKHRSSKNM
mmetsp:Transcript_23905/g.35537  ORF Transcript_23905/g.35537 Transcript_23905/m.35537 type:complete len:554 (-) Transcript_23905:219-1880(-)